MPADDDDPFQAAHAALMSGELLAAFDMATIGLAAGGDAVALHYIRTLALARMGALDQAQRLYDAHLAGQALNLDTLALGARLIKDRAWRASGAERRRLLREASAAYAALHRSTSDPFPAVNAATLAHIAGDRRSSKSLARSAIAATRNGSIRNYYEAATIAEAELLLGHPAEASRMIERALTLPGCDHGARSTTTRQLLKLAEAGVDAAALIERLRPPPVLSYCGHLFVAGLPGEPALAAEVRHAVARIGARYAYGALGCGADLLMAEALLDSGADLHVVLPFRVEDFVRLSVRPGGEEWVARFERCIAHAREVVVASEASALGDDQQFEFGSLLAMGHARLRAAHLCTDAIQLALWDGKETTGRAGTGADVRAWRSHHGETLLVPVDRTSFPPPPRLDAPSGAFERVIRAMIFTDFAGFSRIDERDLPAFWHTVVQALATVVERHGHHVHARNTWGDALYVVVSDARAAAALALDLQATLAGLGLDRFGAAAGMRISAHVGAVYRARDPVTGLVTFYGHEVNKAARIEPITAVGEVYVSHAFAALLAMQPECGFDLSYAGRIALAKNFGTAAMYRLGGFPPPAGP